VSIRGIPKKFYSRGLPEVLPLKEICLSGIVISGKVYGCNRKPAPPTPDSTENVVIIGT